MTQAPLSPRRLALAAAGGAALLVAGLMAAFQCLPEWQASVLAGKSSLVARYLQMARQAGAQVPPGSPAVYMVTKDDETDRAGEAARSSHPGQGSPPARPGGVLRLAVEEPVTMPGEVPHPLRIEFSPQGRPLGVLWAVSSWRINESAITSPDVVRRLLPLLLAPGETTGPPRRAEVSGNVTTGLPILGTGEYLSVFTQIGGSLIIQRRHGDPEQTLNVLRRYQLGDLLVHASPYIVFYLSFIALFLYLLARRRLDATNAALLAALGLAVAASGFAAANASTLIAVGNALQGLSSALLLLILWSAGESLLRSVDPEYVATLDTLRLGRIGPRTGGALILGLALGAGMAGVLLLLQAAVVSLSLPATWPQAASITLPAFSDSNGALGTTFRLAGGLLFLLAAAKRWLPSRFVAVAVAVAGALALSVPLPMRPAAAELICNALVLGGLVALIRRRSGLAALLIAILTAILLPLAVFAATHLDWLPGTFGIATAICLALVAAGVAGLRRSPQVEAQGVMQPAFIRRLEDERRLQYEMDLLARMQLGLLPQELPNLPGWDIAARSMLATEAGGDLYDFHLDAEGMLWVAAGDVAGHGYSCAIVQAMTTAALSSLIAPGKAPSTVLREVDRVLRRGGSRRTFTSLALLRLNPVTGDATLSNAGHPFPFLFMTGGSDMAEVALPGFPLGQGPAQAYVDEPLRLPPGAILVFCSDGLFEAPDWRGDQYGYDRPREVLSAARDLSAARIVDSMLADWRHHLGAAASPDDTTILVIKHLAG
jgi:hypothetical protein